MSNDHITQYPIFPAMEELIGRMPLNDLLILSGFITTCLGVHTNALVTAATALTEQNGDAPGLNLRVISVIQDSGKSILGGTNRISRAIGKRLLDLQKISLLEGDDESRERLREILRRAFPGMAV